MYLSVLFFLISAEQQSQEKSYEGGWKGKLTNSNMQFDIEIDFNKSDKAIFQIKQQGKNLIEKEIKIDTDKKYISIQVSEFQKVKLKVTEKKIIETLFIESGLLQYHISLQKIDNTYKGVWKPWYVESLNPKTCYLNIEQNDGQMVAFPFFDDTRFSGTFAANFQNSNNQLTFVDFMTGIGFEVNFKDDLIDFKMKLGQSIFSESEMKKFEGNFPVGRESEELLIVNDFGKDFLKKLNKKEYGAIDAILISQNGLTLYEKYFNGFDSNVNHQLRSAQKSLTSALVGVAIKEKKINSVNEKLYDYIPQKYFSTKDESKSNITLEHLLTMSSGLDAVDFGTQKKSEAAEDNYQRTRDWTATILNANMINKPGEISNYGSANPHLASLILKNNIDKPLVFYNHEKLMKPLGIENYVVQNEISGEMYFAGGMYLTAKDLLKFGELYLNKGKFNNKRILNKDWVKSSFTEYNKLENDPDKTSYGYYWWLSEYKVGNKDYKSYEARGAGGQYVFIIPELELVTVILSSNYRNGKFKAPEKILKDLILPTILSN